MFCFDVGEWWMTHGPCTSEIKAVNVFMNVCGSPDLLTPPLHLPRLTFHLYVNVCGIIVMLKLKGTSGDFWSRLLLSAGLVSKSDVVAQGHSNFKDLRECRFLNISRQPVPEPNYPVMSICSFCGHSVCSFMF